MTLLDERKAAILRAVVEEYIETAQPVGSAHVAQADGVDVSSATVRNEMALLENEGYLRQPHTSAGRVPTEKGYRFFVDHLQPPRLAGRSADEVRSFFARAHLEVEQMLSDTSRLLSNLTNLTSVVVAPTAGEARVLSAHLVGISTDHRPAGGRAQRRHGREAHGRPAGGRRRRRGHRRVAAGHRPRPRQPPVGGARGAAVGRARRRRARWPGRWLPCPLKPSADPEQLYVGGAARMAQAFDAIETVREVLGILEQQFVVVSLLRDVLDRGLQVAIGTETGMAPLAECALVVAPYDVEGERAGTIGVLGPARMNYPQALAAVAVVSNRLSDRLTEG